MELKTKVHAGEGKQDILITREFDLPLELLFRAYTEPEIVEHWMSTKVLKLDNRPHGGYQFETSHNGQVMFRSNVVYHEFVPNKKITRTFEMENTPFDAQLEFLEFEELTDETSKMTMYVAYRSEDIPDSPLRMTSIAGVNTAHKRLEVLVWKLK